MMQLDQNKRKLYYANYSKDVVDYKRDLDGNIIYTKVNGKEEAVMGDPVSCYAEAVEFEANISFDSGETKQAEYGLNTTDYNAVISANKGELPFNEQTLIWSDSEPKYDGNSRVIPETADYKVVAIKTSLNEERFFLKKQVKDGEIIPPSA